jgi:hypothetical protein
METVAAAIDILICGDRTAMRLGRVIIGRRKMRITEGYRQAGWSLRTSFAHN